MNELNFDYKLESGQLDLLTKEEVKDLIYAAIDNKDLEVYDKLFKYFKDKFQNE